MTTLLSIAALGAPPWPTLDPFLFCVHHRDFYPPGNANMAPDPALLAGRRIGQDFAGLHGWSMYHGETVPGFPAHPHRGFETVTIARQGRIDHFDSLGATARFGGGDVQWLTAGAGIVHCEMFPLVHPEAPNPAELFQIWLNLPAKNKMAKPHFTMFWHENIPRIQEQDFAGRSAEIVCIAGQIHDTKALAPPPASWASEPDSDLGIFTIKLAPGTHWTLPAAQGTQTRRMIYFFKGSSLQLAGQSVTEPSAIEVRAELDCGFVNGEVESELLVLQGRPIGEPVAQHGPFVMNTVGEIQQAFHDYRQTQFGGWPWPSGDPVHARGEARFAKHADGSVERPTPERLRPS